MLGRQPGGVTLSASGLARPLTAREVKATHAKAQATHVKARTPPRGFVKVRLPFVKVRPPLLLPLPTMQPSGGYSPLRT